MEFKIEKKERVRKVVTLVDGKKNCTMCDKILDLSMFSNRTIGIGGKSSICMVCIASRPKKRIEKKKILKINNVESEADKTKFIEKHGTSKSCKDCKQQKLIAADEKSDFGWIWSKGNKRGAFRPRCKPCEVILATKKKKELDDYRTKLKIQQGGCANKSKEYECSEELDFAHWPKCLDKYRTKSNKIIQFSGLRSKKSIDEEMKKGRFLCGVCHAHETTNSIIKQEILSTTEDSIRHRIRRETARNHVEKRKLKIGGCLDCKIQITTESTRQKGKAPLRYFHFDHLPQFVKVQEICKMIDAGYHPDTIDKEIEKCELVCYGCHKKRTASRIL